MKKLKLALMLCLGVILLASVSASEEIVLDPKNPENVLSREIITNFDESPGWENVESFDYYDMGYIDEDETLDTLAIKDKTVWKWTSEKNHWEKEENVFENWCDEFSELDEEFCSLESVDYYEIEDIDRDGEADKIIGKGLNQWYYLTTLEGWDKKNAKDVLCSGTFTHSSESSWCDSPTESFDFYNIGELDADGKKFDVSFGKDDKDWKYLTRADEWLMEDEIFELWCSLSPELDEEFCNLEKMDYYESGDINDDSMIDAVIGKGQNQWIFDGEDLRWEKRNFMETLREDDLLRINNLNKIELDEGEYILEVKEGSWSIDREKWKTSVHIIYRDSGEVEFGKIGSEIYEDSEEAERNGKGRELEFEHSGGDVFVFLVDDSLEDNEGELTVELREKDEEEEETEYEDSSSMDDSDDYEDLQNDYLMFQDNDQDVSPDNSAKVIENSVVSLNEGSDKEKKDDLGELWLLIGMLVLLILVLLVLVIYVVYYR